MIDSRSSVVRATTNVVNGRSVWHAVDEMPIADVELRQDDYAFTARVVKLDDSGNPRHRWVIYEFPPGMDVPFHATATIDYVIVLEGELDLVLPDEPPVHLTAGDCVVQQRALHAWRTGPDRGATVSVVVLHDRPED